VLQSWAAEAAANSAEESQLSHHLQLQPKRLHDFLFFSSPFLGTNQ